MSLTCRVKAVLSVQSASKMMTKKGKTLTKGAKQIKEENASTLNFYMYMALLAMGNYLTVIMILSKFTTLRIIVTIACTIIYIGSYQFMSYMARATYSESGQLLDPGVDLNMEGGIAEHVKDLIILTSGVQVMSLTSIYFLLLWLLVPIRGSWILWKHIFEPWFFAQPQEQSEMNEKKMRKLERKMAKRY